MRVDDGAKAFMILLTPSLREFATNPPEDSATARAKSFGYDVVATAMKLATTTPQERLSALDRRIEEVRALRAAMRR